MPATNNAALFRTAWFPELVARIFATRPRQNIWQWADDKNVFLDATMAAEPGFYDSRKTPWTRRIQELCQHPFRYVTVHKSSNIGGVERVVKEIRKIRVRKIAVKKSSQSGFTEAVLNAIRFFAKFLPRNVIYSIDTAEEAANIRDRLAKTLPDETLTGDDDDMKRTKLTLRHMIVWFYGSFAPGKYANKQAPFGVVDEAAQHKNGKRSVGDVESRTKWSDEGLVAVISKLEHKDDVIDSEHAQGDQEIYLVPCPFCGTYQELTLEKLKFEHCKNLLHEWDLDRVLREASIQCEATYCASFETLQEIDREIPAGSKPDKIKEFIRARVPPRLIPESYKEWMVGVDENNNERGHWFATHAGDPECDPEIVSMEINDLYSLSASVSWGRLSIRIIKTKGDPEARKVLWTQSFTRAWEQATFKPQVIDVIKCKANPPYKRGTIPWKPVALLLGSDVGEVYAKWVVIAVDEADNFALIDWGSELSPAGIAQIMNEKRYPSPTENKFHDIWQGVIDAHFHTEDVYSSCLLAPGKLWPVMGGGSARSRQALAWVPCSTYPKSLRLLTFKDRDFKDELYLRRIKRKVPPDLSEQDAIKFRDKMPRLLLPSDITPELIEEFINEHLIDDEWKRPPGKPNHWADCVKEVCVFWRWAVRALFKRAPAFIGSTAAEQEEKDASMDENAPDIT